MSTFSFNTDYINEMTSTHCMGRPSSYLRPRPDTHHYTWGNCHVHWVTFVLTSSAILCLVALTACETIEVFFPSFFDDKKTKKDPELICLASYAIALLCLVPLLFGNIFNKPKLYYPATFILRNYIVAVLVWVLYEFFAAWSYVRNHTDNLDKQKLTADFLLKYTNLFIKCSFYPWLAVLLFVSWVLLNIAAKDQLYVEKMKKNDVCHHMVTNIGLV